MPKTVYVIDGAEKNEALVAGVFLNVQLNFPTHEATGVVCTTL